jgi:hypothetical protein
MVTGCKAEKTNIAETKKQIKFFCLTEKPLAKTMH